MIVRSLKKSFKKIAAAALGFVFFTACHPTKKAAENPTGPATNPLPVATLQKKSAENAFRAERLSAKAKIEFSSEAQSLSATANLIWVKDSVLFLVVKKFGFEGARALVTRDSVFVINRLDQTFTAKSIAALSQQFQLPAHFELLNALVQGQAWFLPEAKMESSVKDGRHRLEGSDGRLNEVLTIENGHFLLKTMSFLEKRASRSVTLSLDDFKPMGKMGNFSFLRHVETYSPEAGKTELEAQLSDVEINVFKPFRFEIPAHYRRVD